MSQNNLLHMVSKLRVKVLPRYRNFKNTEGINGRILNLRKVVTALIRYERIEASFFKADESRGYAERLISEAIRYGPKHKPTMEMASYWIEDKNLVPKLFEVLVPRYQDWPSHLPYTRMLKAPWKTFQLNHGDIWEERRTNYYFQYERAVLELRGNPYPPLPGPNARQNPGLIHNILLEEAKKDYYNQKRIDMDSKTQMTTSERKEAVSKLVADQLSESKDEKQ